MHADKGFWSILNNLVNNWGVSINFANPDDNVQEIDKDNKMVRERFYVAILLPYII